MIYLSFDRKKECKGCFHLKGYRIGRVYHITDVNIKKKKKKVVTNQEIVLSTLLKVLGWNNPQSAEGHCKCSEKGSAFQPGKYSEARNGFRFEKGSALITLFF